MTLKSFGFTGGYEINMKTYRIVDTDNFGGDYPDEKFVGPEFTDKKLAEKYANENHNNKMDDYSSRYWRIVEMPYKLQPGFEP